MSSTMSGAGIGILGLVAGYMCVKMAKIVAASLAVGVVIIYFLKEYDYITPDYTEWRQYVQEASTKIELDTYWNKFVTALETTSKWMQRGFVAGVALGFIYTL